MHTNKQTVGSLKLSWLAMMATALLAGPAPAADGGKFTRLTLLSAPRIIAEAQAFSDSYKGENVLKPLRPNQHHAEYATRNLGERTFIDFDLGQPTKVAAFHHIQRQTIDTISESNLIFSDAPDFKTALATVTIKHVDEPGATTFAAFAPVTARYVRWQVTSVLASSRNVGGQVIEFFSAEKTDPSPSGIGIAVRLIHVIERKGGAIEQPDVLARHRRAFHVVESKNGATVQPLKVTFDYPYGEPVNAIVRVEGQQARPLELKFGSQTLEYTVAASDAERTLNIAIEVAGKEVTSRAVTLKPSHKLTVYILPHSHTDIGYTAVQTTIEEKQVNNLLEGMAIARRTANYPPGARFVWNVEVLWAADLFLRRFPPEQQAEFFDAVKRGQVALNGMYLNELTGLCRPEELVRLFRYTTQLGERAGVPIDSAMISDVPAYTWGTVTALTQAGIRYLSAGVNGNADRCGTVFAEWENKPFWWIGPDGTSKVLVWVPYQGYSLSHLYRVISQHLVEDFCAALDRQNYPYDIAYIRWSGNQGDNSVPDPDICESVRDWNATHVWPQFVISSTSEAFQTFEKHYGDKLPQVRGDFTPYWEDGAGTSAAETAMNRSSSERLSQAEALWAMLDPKHFPAKKFEDAWNNVLLYSEHTWGASTSITEPMTAFVWDQWNIKQSYATIANLQSRQLLSEAAQVGEGFQPGESAAQFDIFNTTSWPRSEVVLIPHAHPPTASFVTDDQGRPVPSQRLANRELAVFVRDLPPFSGRRYTITNDGKAKGAGNLKATGAVIENEKLRIRLDEKTGGIVELRAKGIEANLADTTGGNALNDYLYLIGNDLAALQHNGPVTITVRDHGPLVESLLVESDAPGCHKLSREIRLVAGGDYVELLDTVDKKRLEAKSYYANEGKESINFAFPFNVPDGELRLDIPFAVMRPELDQIPGACKNSLPVGRWAEVANRDFGVTWVTLDAPIVEIGEISGTLFNSQTSPYVWRKKIEPSQKLYSWVMNNHWHTNYRAYQEGPVLFRYILRPHRATTPAEISRFATGFSQPLVVVPARGRAPSSSPLLRVEPADVLVTALKPSDDGKAWIIRLFGAGTASSKAKLSWAQPAPKRIWLSDTSEKPLKEVGGDIPVPSLGVVTLRAELPK